MKLAFPIGIHRKYENINNNKKFLYFEQITQISNKTWYRFILTLQNSKIPKLGLEVKLR